MLKYEYRHVSKIIFNNREQCKRWSHKGRICSPNDRQIAIVKMHEDLENYIHLIYKQIDNYEKDYPHLH